MTAAARPPVLVLAALAEEANALLPGAGEAVPDPAFPHRRVDQHGRTIIIAVCGVGKANAAAAGAVLAARHPPALIAMTGTCGSLTGRAGGTFWISAAAQHDYGARLDSGFVHYRAGDWPIGPAGPAHFSAMADPGLGLPHAVIASGDSFVADAAHGTAIAAALGADLVDMEVAAVAQLAARLNLPWAAIKAVTDDANGASGGDFMDNLGRAAAAAADAMARLIARV